MNAFSGRGSGSSGSGGVTQPTETADTLRSKDRIEVILGLCEGPIKGPTNGEKSYIVGSTQYQNEDGSYNLDLFQIETFPGQTPGELIVPVLGGHEDWRGLNLALTQGNTQNWTTQGASMSQVIVRLKVTALYQTGTNAQLAALPGVSNTVSSFLPNTFQMDITYQSAAGEPFRNPFGSILTIEGKTQTSEYHEIRCLVEGPGPYNFRATCLTPDLPFSRCTVELEGYYEVTGGMFGVARSTNVSTALATGQQVLRTTQYPGLRKDGLYGIDFICVRLLVNSLYAQNADGIFEADCRFILEYKRSSQPNWISLFDGEIVIHGKTTSTPYVSEYRWPVDAVQDTYDIRITRTTGDDVGQSRQVSWESFQEIVGGPATFDGTATMHIVGQASDQFSSIPDFSSIQDLKICQIPSNYDPYGRTYSGVWDGTFKLDWTSNPAWCLYDLGMNTRYGARAAQPDYTLDRYDCYAAGVMCDELVPDGSGGYQPRYTFNGIISEPRGIRDQQRYMAGVFNGAFLDDLNGNVRVVFDQDEPAAAIFTPENVTSEGFTYSYTDISTRFNYVTAKFNDPAINYAINSVLIFDQAHIDIFGRIPLEFSAIGCTNAHEAFRRGSYKLLSATTEKEIVSFKTNRQGLMLRPLHLIMVGDPDMGNSITGRILSISEDRTVVYLRDIVYLEQGISYIFRTHMANPNYPATSDAPLAVVEIPFYSPVNGGTLVFALNVPLPAGVDDRASFSLGAEGSVAGVPKVYRITQVEEGDGDPDNVMISAIEVNRYKLALADNAVPRAGLAFLNLPADIAPPSNLTITTETISVNGDVLANVVAVWLPSPDPRTRAYQLQYRLSGEVEWITISSPTRPRADIYNVPNGIYDFRLAATVSTSVKSAWVYKYSQTAGLNVPPGDVTDLVIASVGSHFSLSWGPVAAQNLSYYWVRYSPLTDGTATWEGATDVVQKVLATSIQIAASSGTYFVKAVNTAGVESVNASYVVGHASQLGLTTVEILDQSPAWSGTKTNFSVFTGIMFADPYTAQNFVYEFLTSDYTAPFTCNLLLGMIITADKPGEVITSWTSLSSVTSLAGVPPGSYDTRVEIASFNGTTWGEYGPFSVGLWTGQQFKFRITVTTVTPNIQPLFYRCSLTVQMQARTEAGSLVLTEAGGSTINFVDPFKVVPSITVTNRNAVKGDYYIIENVTTAYFSIQWYDGTGASVSRLMDWFAVGFGGR